MSPASLRIRSAGWPESGYLRSWGQINTVLIQRGQGYGNPAAVPACVPSAVGSLWCELCLLKSEARHNPKRQSGKAEYPPIQIRFLLRNGALCASTKDCRQAVVGLEVCIGTVASRRISAELIVRRHIRREVPGCRQCEDARDASESDPAPLGRISKTRSASSARCRWWPDSVSTHGTRSWVMKVSYWIFGSVGLSAYHGSVPNVGSIIVRLYWFCALSPIRVCIPSPKVVPSPASTGSTKRKLWGTPGAGFVGFRTRST